MSKKDKQILVVKKDVLLKDYFKGFSHAQNFDYASIILNNINYISRNAAEDDLNFKQPIAYAIIINPELKKVFAYQRSPKHCNEKKLREKYSWGVGGHIEKQDNGNPIESSMLREISEEVEIKGKIKSFNLLGYINHDETEVDKVHFGVLYLIKTDAKEVNPKDPEIDSGSLKTLKELNEICSKCDVENWSKIALEVIKNMKLI